jgi:hypothetical protein
MASTLTAAPMKDLKIKGGSFDTGAAGCRCCHRNVRSTGKGDGDVTSFFTKKREEKAF